MDFEFICFEINSREELDFFLKKANDKGFINYDEQELYYDKYPKYLFLSLKFKTITIINIPYTFIVWGGDDVYKDNIYDFIQFRIDNGVEILNKVFKYTDIIHLDQIIKYGTIKPSYKPKKLIKESSINYPYRFKTREEMVNYYGEEWEEKFDNIGWNTDMDIFLGEDYPYWIDENDIKNWDDDEFPLPTHHDTINNMTWHIHPEMLIKNKPKKPSYKPRKLIKESIEEYPYRFRTEKEFIDDFGEEWSNNFFGIGWTDAMNELFGLIYPYTENDISTFDDYYGKLPNIRGPRTNMMWSVHKNMLIKNKPKKPSYKPRQIIKESTESKYTEFVVQVNNEGELLLGIDKLKLNGLVYIDFNFTHIEYPNWFFINLNNNEFSLWDDISFIEYIQSYISNNKEMYPEILNLNDIPKIINYIKYGKFDPRPTYKPKQIIRESITNIDEITVKIDSEEIYNIIKILINEHGYFLPDYLSDYTNIENEISRYEYVVFYINFINKKITYSPPSFREAVIDEYKSIHPILLTIKDIDSIVMFMKFGKLIKRPHYKPKKIEK